VDTLRTGPNAIAALDRKTYHPYSDFLLHDMGALGDNLEMAAPPEPKCAPRHLVRTAPGAGTVVCHQVRPQSPPAALRRQAVSSLRDFFFSSYEFHILGYERVILAYEFHILGYARVILAYEFHILGYERVILAYEIHILGYTRVIFAYEFHILGYARVILAYEFHILGYARVILACG
jgi:hypothetical protein